MRLKSKTIKGKYSDRTAQNPVISGLFVCRNRLFFGINSGSSDHYDSCRFKSCFPHQSPETKVSGLFICFGEADSLQKTVQLDTLDFQVDCQKEIQCSVRRLNR